MKNRIKLLALAAALGSSTLATVASAKPQTPAKMSCEQFVALVEADRPKVLFWAEGFDRKGKANSAIVDVEETDTLVPILVSECQKAPKKPLAKALHHVRELRNKVPPPTRSTPAAKKARSGHAKVEHVALSKMSCEDFIETEEVARPKVVYWAEGFDKKGKSTGAVFDIEKTDALVPVVIKECTETPKLSFWERLKKHL